MTLNNYCVKVLQFTIPVPVNKTIITQTEVLPHFYPHLHRHHEIQLTWIQDGKGTLIAENNMFNFSSNEIYWLGANQPHLFKNDPVYFLPRSKKLTKALTVFFNPTGSLSYLFDLPELKNIKKFIQQYPSGFKIPANMVNSISEQMLQIKNSSGADQLITFISILKRLATCKNLLPLTSSVQPRQYSEHEGLKIGRIFNYIMQNADQSIKLEEVAAQAHMTPQAFCRYFKKHTRHTFISFLNEVRINKACKKLTDGDYESISDIAYDCGFNSVTSFNRVFKTVTKLSPSQYLGKYLKNLE
jgi:AraC-like DNA-binding protein